MNTFHQMNEFCVSPLGALSPLWAPLIGGFRVVCAGCALQQSTASPSPSAELCAISLALPVRHAYAYATEDWQELISRWDSEHERFYDDIVHVQASAYAHWTEFLSMLIRVAANQGRSSTSFIASQRNRWNWFSKILAANHLCTYANQTELSDFVLPK